MILCSTMKIMLQRNYDAMKHIISMFIPGEPREFSDYICDDGMGMVLIRYIAKCG